jgi:hypothetical protein
LGSQAGDETKTFPVFPTSCELLSSFAPALRGGVDPQLGLNRRERACMV